MRLTKRELIDRARRVTGLLSDESLSRLAHEWGVEIVFDYDDEPAPTGPPRWPTTTHEASQPLVLEPYAHNYRVRQGVRTVALVSFGGEGVMAEAVRAFNEKCCDWYWTCDGGWKRG